MNVIFLDCDGVLSLMPQWIKGHLEDGDCDFDRDCLKLLDDLIDEFPDIKIVVSSSWRYGKYVEDLQLIFKHREFKNYLSIVGRTIGIDTEGFDLETRTEEIIDWISKNKVKKYIVLDDERSLIQQIPNKNKIIINEDKGLQREHCEKIKEYFGR